MPLKKIEIRDLKASMRIPRIYLKQPLPKQLGAYQLESEAAHYLKNVLRAQPGRQIKLFDGGGADYLAEIIQVEKKHISVELLEIQSVAKESSLAVHLGQVLSKGDRMDYALQKSVELGVSEISPLTSERCDVRLDRSREAKRQNHWQAVVASACEQSGRACLPPVHEVQSCLTWANNLPIETKLFFHPQGQALSKQRFFSETQVAPSANKQIAIAIGPEGGWSDAECQALKGAGFIAIQLGPRILRTETAPVAAISLLQFLWGDF